MVLTGCRIAEILKLKWTHVEVDAVALRFLDLKTCAEIVHLDDPRHRGACRASPGPRQPWVITGSKRQKPLQDLQYRWGRIRSGLGLMA